MTHRLRRASDRLGLSVTCEVREGCEPWTRVTLTDLSRAGFRMAWLPRFKTDGKVWIRMPGLAPLSAMVRWRNTSGVGCEFSAPLYEPVFDHFARHAAPVFSKSA